MKTPLIFDIKRSSTVDGPGLRTVVFFKGCNLDCFWCHNPEGKSPDTQIAFFKEKCISCGVCHNLCKNSFSECSACGKCVSTCPANARKLYGKKYTIPELLDIISSDKLFFEATGGGVTFSGGECMLYPEYIAQLSKICKANGISVAIDTAGCVPYSNFEKVLPYVDTFLFDIKCLNPELHKKGTGKRNELILQNLELLQKTGKNILIRVPVIPNFNDSEELARIKSFCSERCLTVELLPYHKFGIDKKNALEQFKNVLKTQ